jgi:hypothetical protein
LVHLAKLFQRRRSSSSRYGVNSSTSRLKLQRMVGEQQKIARVCTIKMSLFTVKSSWYCSHVSDESRHSDGIFCMWCLNDSTVGWLRNSGGRKFQDTMVLGRNEYLYASTLVLIWWMQGNDHLTWRGGGGGGSRDKKHKYSNSRDVRKKNITPPLQVKWSVPNGHTGSSSSGGINLDVLMEWYFHQVDQDSVKHYWSTSDSTFF